MLFAEFDIEKTVIIVVQILVPALCVLYVAIKKERRTDKTLDDKTERSLAAAFKKDRDRYILLLQEEHKRHNEIVTIKDKRIDELNNLCSDCREESARREEQLENKGRQIERLVRILKNYGFDVETGIHTPLDNDDADPTS